MKLIIHKLDNGFTVAPDVAPVGCDILSQTLVCDHLSQALYYITCKMGKSPQDEPWHEFAAARSTIRCHGQAAT